MTNTQIKFVLIAIRQAPLSLGQIEEFMNNIHDAYITAVMNPFQPKGREFSVTSYLYGRVRELIQDLPASLQPQLPSTLNSSSSSSNNSGHSSVHPHHNHNHSHGHTYSNTPTSSPTTTS